MTTTDIWDAQGTPAEQYERVVLPAVIAPWVGRVVDLAAPAPGDRVLDVACGTGIVGRTVAAMFGGEIRFFGVDLDPGMLAVGRSEAGSLRALRGDAQALPFTDASFDVVYCQLGLMFMPDRGRALQEMRRVLKPGGRVGLMAWGRMEECPVFEAWARTLGEHLGPEPASAAALPFALGDTGILEGLLREAQFREVAVVREKGEVRFPSLDVLLRTYANGLRMTEWFARSTPETRARMVADMRAACAAYESERGLEFPITALLARATA